MVKYWGKPGVKLSIVSAEGRPQYDRHYTLSFG